MATGGFTTTPEAAKTPRSTRRAGSPGRPDSSCRSRLEGLPTAHPGRDSNAGKAYRDAWLVNLRSAGVTHLFVSVLSAYEIDFVSHNADGFPLEDDWARADPRAFRLIYENGQVRIYALAQP